MQTSLLLLLMGWPAIAAGVAWLLRGPRAVWWFVALGTGVEAGLAALAAVAVFRHGPCYALGQWFMLDALSAWHLLVMAGVFALGAVNTIGYFGGPAEAGAAPVHGRRYAALWFGALGALTVVLLSNNIGIMWVGIESTTLLTAFLICTHRTPAALEAMWKYLLMCSVGVALAFVGILLATASASAAGLHGDEVLLWTRLREVAGALHAPYLKVAFVFLVVGYGTKAGLAPMHNWLPDAHSQAPAPVSALFSGALLNAALYCILRCLPLVEAATGNTGWGRDILVVCGLLSVLVGAAFVVTQRDIKRLLAYSSVEHIGVVALGAGLGGIGLLAAMLHTANHAMAKTLAFLCAGRLGRIFGTHEMAGLAGMCRRAPWWGTGLLLGVLALIGMAPFGVFVSEFLVLKAAIAGGRPIVAAVLLLGLAVVFVGALRPLIAMAWGEGDGAAPAVRVSLLDGLTVVAPVLGLLLLGTCPPGAVLQAAGQAAALLGGAP